MSVLKEVATSVGFYPKGRLGAELGREIGLCPLTGMLTCRGMTDGYAACCMGRVIRRF